MRFHAPACTTRAKTLAPSRDATEPTSTRPAGLIRLPRVEELTSLKKSAIYAGVRARTFPSPVRLTTRAVAWREQDVLDWCESRLSTVAEVEALN